MRPPFPRVLDNTILNTFRSCPQKAFLEFFHHWKPGAPNVHLHAGASFAAGLEGARRWFYEQSAPANESVAYGLKKLIEAYGDFQAPEDSAKSLLGTSRALEYYFDVWPLGEDPVEPLRMPSGKRAIEFSFVEPLPIQHPETGEPILYSGRSDMLCKYQGGNWVEDDKTTGSLGSSWAQQWELRSQFTGYCWAAGRTGLRVDGVLVRGVAIQKTGYKHAQHITFRPRWEIDRWLEQTLSDIHRMIECWKSGYWDWNLGESCSAYGGCMFNQICKTQTPKEYLEIYFQRREWDPVTRKETAL